MPPTLVLSPEAKALYDATMHRAVSESFLGRSTSIEDTRAMVRGVFYESANLNELNRGETGGEERVLEIQEARLAKAALELQAQKNAGVIDLSTAQAAYADMTALQKFLSECLLNSSLTQGLRCQFLPRIGLGLFRNCFQSDLAKKLQQHTVGRAKGAPPPREELVAKNKLSYIPSQKRVAHGITIFFQRHDIVAFDGDAQQLSLIDSAYAYLLCNVSAGGPKSKIDAKAVAALAAQGSLFSIHPVRALKELFPKGNAEI